MLKWDSIKGMPVAITALIGFPGNDLLCEEVSRSIGKNKEEENALFKEFLTPMLIGGFTTVTIASVVPFRIQTKNSLKTDWRRIWIGFFEQKLNQQYIDSSIPIGKTYK